MESFRIIWVFIAIGFGFTILETSAEKLTCYKCGFDDENCIIKPDDGKGDECGEDEKCYTKVDDKFKNERGCLKKDELCDGEKCTPCDKNLCNKDLLPKDRSVCHKCNGEDCDKASTSSPCKDYDKTKLGCFTYNDGKTKTKGCISEVIDLCTKNEAYCQKWPDSESNKEPTGPLKCYICSDDKNCKRPEQLPETNCNITGFEPVACEPETEAGNLCYFHRYSNNTVSRGCAKDKPKDVVEGLTLCEGNQCNKNCTEDIKCAVCNQKDDKKCASKDEKESWNKDCPAYTTTCHRCEDKDGQAFRGCGAPPSAQNETCNYCYANNCKSKRPPRECYTCNKTNSKCSQDATKALLPTEKCEDGKRFCIVKLTDGFTERRCAKDDEKCPENSTDCKICSENNTCNNEIIPANRILCYQCNANETSCQNPLNTENTEKLLPVPCQIHKSDDQCYMYANDKDEMIRGCSSDPEANENIKGCKDEKCVKCNSSNCNNSPFKSTSLSCYQCDESDPKCALEFTDETVAKSCKESPYYKNATCFTHVDGTKVNRGCTLDDTKFNCTDDKNTKCHVCNTKSCNKDNFLKMSCYQCRSDVQDEYNCAKENVPDIKSKPCLKEIGEKNRGCYTERWNNIIMRSCLSDLSEDEMKECESNTKLCVICRENDCNNKKAPDSAALNAISLLVLSITSFFILILM